MCRMIPSPRGLGQRRCRIIFYARFIFRLGIVAPITFYVPCTFQIVMLALQLRYAASDRIAVS